MATDTKAQAPVLAPFRAGTQPTYKPSGYSQVNALTTTAIELPDQKRWVDSLAAQVPLTLAAEMTEADIEHAI